MRIGASVRAKLLSALGLLVAAMLAAALVAWWALDQSEARLARLNDTTIRAVDNALKLSDAASALSTTAPFLLAAKSPFRIARQAQASRALTTTLTDLLPQDETVLRDVAAGLRRAVDGLERASIERSGLEDRILRLNAGIAALERRLALYSGSADIPPLLRQEWLSLQRLAVNLLGAGRAENLVGVGEFQRAFHEIATRLGQSEQIVGRREFEMLVAMAHGGDGVFELRRRELARQIEAESALAAIRGKTGQILAHATAVSGEAKALISAQSLESAGALAFSKSFIVAAALISVLVALAASRYVAAYLSDSLTRVARAMTRLAQGDRSARLPRRGGSADEVGALFRAFRVFRANALRLDRNNRRMAQRNRLLEAIFGGMSDGVAIVGPAGTITASNETFGKLLALPGDRTTAGLSLAGILDAGGWRDEAVEIAGIRRLQSETGRMVELRSAALDGGGAVVLVTDTTERNALDARLEHLRHIEGLAKIAGEVAHDFGNILSRLAVNADLLKSARPATRKRALDAFAAAIDHGTGLTQRLLSFAKRQRLAPETVDLNELVAGMEDLIHLALPDGVRLGFVAHPGTLPVHVDAGQMEAAILNLCVNAGQAVSETGSITVTTALDQAGQATLSVADDGCGMSEDVRHRAMEPFFSARPDGRGTGLGLAMVYGFVRQSGGNIDLQSAPGAGTTVTLALPLARPVAAEGQAGVPVLVVDDNADDLRHAAGLIGKTGMRPVLATDAAEAIGRLCRAEHAFAHVVTDLDLGDGDDGFAVARAAIGRDPRTRVAIISGRLPARLPEDLAGSARVTMAGKPFSLDMLDA